MVLRGVLLHDRDLSSEFNRREERAKYRTSRVLGDSIGITRSSYESSKYTGYLFTFRSIRLTKLRMMRLANWVWSWFGLVGHIQPP